MPKLNPKKFFLYLLVLSVSLSAGLGIAVILFGSFGEFETRVLLTTLTITCTSILGLACGASIKPERANYLPLSGIAVSILSAVIWIIFIWLEDQTSDFYARLMMTITLFAMALSHLSLISLASLDSRFWWSIPTTYVSVSVLIFILLGMIWGDGIFESEFTMRVLGAISIVVAALTVVVPIFHKLSDNLNESVVIDIELERLKKRIAELEERKKEISSDSE